MEEGCCYDLRPRSGIGHPTFVNFWSYKHLKEIDDTDDRRFIVNTLLIFVSLVALAGGDIVADLGEGPTSSHVVIELAVVLIGITGALYVAQKLRIARRQAGETTKALALMSEDYQILATDAARWREQVKELMAGLSEAIDEQFKRWGLTEAEKEVGLLLLKGLSHKEISEVRRVADTTIRQQARALYQKAHLAGRSELSAFFLEDLLAPRNRM